jgi:hypothetical protein
VETLIRSAHRRSLTILGIEQAALAATLVLAGCTLVLITGTLLLNWYWIGILALVGLAAATYRLLRRIPSAYDTAQLLDRRLALHDTISTAWHLSQNPELAATEAGQFQLSQAEKAAAEANAIIALPLRFKRSWALPVGLAAVACALFTVRYFVQRDLDLSHSLVPLRLNELAGNRANPAASGRGAPGNVPNQEADGAAQPDSSALNSRMGDVAGADDPEATAAGARASAAELPRQNIASDPTTNSGNQDSQNGDSTPGEQSSRSSNRSADNGATASDQSMPQRPIAAQEKNNGNSLMNRMKDAVSSLMAKLKPSEGSEQRSAQESARSASTPDRDQSQSDSAPSRNQTSAPQASQSAQTDSKGNQQSQAAEVAQSPQSHVASRSESSGHDQAKSGIGRQDGEKKLKAAEEERAMGKLAEIIGKRSRDVSGDMMVEAPSGKEQLRTAYSGKLAEHSDTGGEINSDEIPVELQEYVREYMERIHQQPLPAPKTNR